MKVVLDKGCREIDGPTGIRYTGKDGVFDVGQRDAQGVVAIGGTICSLAGTTRTSYGYPCKTCGFGSYFKECSRCREKGSGNESLILK